MSQKKIEDILEDVDSHQFVESSRSFIDQNSETPPKLSLSTCKKLMFVMSKNVCTF